jgi:formate hydrogenlyase subunit 6/NADH:ubiquinone oxidoreductase subunit I
MNILELLAGNLARGPQTRRFPDRPERAPDYRGAVVNDPGICVTCGICSTVCPSAAIELEPGHDSSRWVYDPARCMFCGSCVMHCPVGALSQEPDQSRTSHPEHDTVAVTVTYPLCPDCGAPAPPYNEGLLERAFGERAPELRARARRCERCRTRDTVQGMKKAFGACPDARPIGKTTRSGHGR